MKRIRKQSAGFTLVELLVSISIVGILMAVLIPAVNRSRESTRRVRCANHLRNLALASIQYEAGHQQYPGYLQSFGQWGSVDANSLLHTVAQTTSSLSDPSDPLNSFKLPHEKIGTWAVALLPYLEAQATYEFWTDDRYPLITNHLPAAGNYNPIAVPNLPIFQCPSDPGDDGDHGRNSYVSNNGYVDPSGGLIPQQFAASMKRANGLFNNKFQGRNLLHDVAATPVGPAVRADDVRDGLSSTVMFSENLQADRWYRVGLDLVESQALVSPALHLNAVAARGYHGMVWQRYDDSGAGLVELPPVAAKINGALPLNSLTEPLTFDVARPSSEHPGGVNVVFADGTLRFITNTIEYRAYQALLTPHGKASDVPFPEYRLTPEAY